MANFCGILLFLLVVSGVCSTNLIYRRYEKKHPRKNYVQIVEIFGTRQRPPNYSKDDKNVNDFLANDSYNTDRNCSEVTGKSTGGPVSEETVTSIIPPATERTTKSTTTTRRIPAIPTTAFRAVTRPSITKPSFTTTPNLNNLFTPPRTTKPTVIPNPKENNNPDYTNLDTHLPRPDIQVTKHPPTTIPPTILIKESDELTNPNVTVVTIPPDSLEDEIIYPDENEDGEIGDRDYNEDNYHIISQDNFDVPSNTTNTESDEDYDDQDNVAENSDEERKKRRKRKSKRLATLKSKRKAKP